MGSHIGLMKTTIEIADDLFNRARDLAHKRNTTFRALAEEGLRMVLEEREAKPKKFKWKPVFGQGKPTPEFENASWDKIRDAIYEGRGS